MRPPQLWRRASAQRMVVTALACLMTAGCAAQARSPEPIPIDRVQCAFCGMVISTEVGAAQLVGGGEDTRFYDDIGCLVADRAARPDRASAFVRLADGTWTDVATASFAYPPSAQTAMGSGLAAFATIAAARAADREGRAWTWDEIRQRAGGGR
jgi:nitrous oxide reductase accessory protein NosL